MVEHALGGCICLEFQLLLAPDREQKNPKMYYFDYFIFYVNVECHEKFAHTLLDS